MKALRLLVIKLCAELNFSKCRSKVTVKNTCSKYMLPSERSCHQEHTCQIWKSGQTGSRTDRRRAKWSLSGALLRWRYNNIWGGGGSFFYGGHFSISHTLNNDSLGIYSTGWTHYPTAGGHFSTLNNDRGSFFSVE